MAGIETPITVLEVGCGLTPFPGEGERRFFPEDRYIGIDLFTDYSDAKIQHVDLETRRKHGDPLDITIQRGDGRDLPFADGTIDEVVFVNVFGDRRTFDYQPQLRREAARVMRAAGSLTVVETLSTSEKPLDTLVEEMRTDGLVLIGGGFARMPTTIAQYVYPSQKIRRGLIDRAYAATFISAEWE